MAQFCIDCGAYDHTDSPQCPQCGADDRKPVEYNPLKESRRINFEKLEEMEYEVTSRRRYVWNLVAGKLKFALKRGRRLKLAFSLVFAILITFVAVVFTTKLI
jgi:uncharacterized membrane protein YvbJ